MKAPFPDLLGSGQVTMLFPGEESIGMLSAPEAIDRNAKLNYSGSEVLLETHLMSEVEEILRSGIQSARVMTELLIRNGWPINGGIRPVNRICMCGSACMSTRNLFLKATVSAFRQNVGRSTLRMEQIRLLTGVSLILWTRICGAQYARSCTRKRNGRKTARWGNTGCAPGCAAHPAGKRLTGALSQNAMVIPRNQDPVSGMIQTNCFSDHQRSN